jgi:hypothetical protein
MAADAQGNQVQIVVRALLAAQLLVVDLQVLSGTADLALPAISFSLPADEVVRTTRDQAAREVVSVERGSRSLLGHFVQKSLSLFARKEFEEP